MVQVEYLPCFLGEKGKFHGQIDRGLCIIGEIPRSIKRENHLLEANNTLFGLILSFLQ